MILFLLSVPVETEHLLASHLAQSRKAGAERFHQLWQKTVRGAAPGAAQTPRGVDRPPPPPPPQGGAGKLDPSFSRSLPHAQPVPPILDARPARRDDRDAGRCPHRRRDRHRFRQRVLAPDPRLGSRRGDGGGRALGRVAWRQGGSGPCPWCFRW